MRPRDRRHRPTFAIVTAVVMVGLVIGTVTPAAAKDRRKVPQWSGLVAKVVAEVEDIRGLKFEKAVPVQFLDDRAFEKAYGGGSEPPPDIRTEIRHNERVDRALGLIPEDVDLVEAISDDPAGGVIGFYTGGRVVLRGTELSVVTEVILAHELTHVLQHQHSLVRVMNLPSDGLEALMVRALAEGDASWVQWEYVSRQSPDRRQRFTERYTQLGADLEERRGQPPLELLAVRGLLPYVHGEELVSAIVADRGTSGVNRALRNQPPNDATMLNVLATTDGTQHVRVPKLGRGETRKGEPERLGALGLFHLLASRLDPLTALTAADAWAGDRMVLFRRGTDDCVRASFVARDEAGTSLLAAGLAGWAQAAGNAVAISDEDGVTITACDGVPRGPARSLIEADRVAAARNRLALNGLEDGRRSAAIGCTVHVFFDDPAFVAAVAAQSVPAAADDLFAQLAQEHREVATRTCGYDPGPLALNP